MIRKALQNRYVVSAMAVIAVLLVASQMRSTIEKWPWHSRPTPPRAAHVQPVQTKPQVDAEELDVDTSKLQWGGVLERNPFQPAKTLLPASGVEKGQDPLSDPKPKLSAVWIENQSRWAVLNKHVVREGERIQEWRVRSIHADRVVVDGPRGELTVHFNAAAN